MAFRLKNAKSIRAQLARIVAKELRKAADDVSRRSLREASIHDVRKHVKKVRAVLRLLRKELGDDYAPLNEQIRSAARRLSAVRDADALIEMMKALRRRYRRVLTPTVVRTANATLKARMREARAHLAGRPLADIRRQLVHSSRGLRSKVREAATGRAMRDGVTRGYRRARRAMAEATAAKTEDGRFHAWRRRVKDHWYQMRLVEGINRRAHPRVRRLRRLQDWLGDDHNLVVLRDAILEQPHRFGDARAVAVMRSAAFTDCESGISSAWSLTGTSWRTCDEVLHDHSH